MSKVIGLRTYRGGRLGTARAGHARPGGAQRSAQGDCVREVERRGFKVVSTGNFQQSRDGWQLDVRARDSPRAA